MSDFNLDNITQYNEVKIWGITYTVFSSGCAHRGKQDKPKRGSHLFPGFAYRHPSYWAKVDGNPVPYKLLSSQLEAAYQELIRDQQPTG